MVAPLVVVGASLAGLRAVEAARTAGWTGRVVLVGAESHLPYDRPPLSKAVLMAGDVPAPTTFRTREQLAALDVELRLGTAATGLDVDAREVHLGDARQAYAQLVVATGAHARHLPGDPLPGVHVLRTVEDARAVRAALDAGARTVVVGAGFIGTEVASAARSRGLPVTVVEAAPVPLVRAVGGVVAPLVAALHQRAGVDLRCGAGVRSVEGDGRVERVVLTDGTVLPADVLVVGTGAVPATGWLDRSGLILDDGVVCDETLAAAPGVWAAGDVARWHNGLFEQSMRLEHWTSAAEQGAHAGRCAADPSAATPFRTVPYAWSDVHGHTLQAVGVTSADEVRVLGDVAGDRWLALYRRADRAVGAFSVNLPGRIMKHRRLIAAQAPWEESLALAG